MTTTTPASPESAETLDICRGHSMASQFGHPHGVLGWLAGEVMARKNAGLNAATVDVLDPQPGDRVLEIGFGHGRTVAALARRARFVAGVDPSRVMVAQARRRNRAALRAGGVELHEASVARIPYPDGSFDRVLSVNSIQHWPDPVASLREVRRVLRTDGVLVLGLRMHEEGGGRLSAPGFSEADVDRLERMLGEAGYADVRRERRSAGRELTCLVARC